MTNILLWILFGGIAGWLASLIMKKDAQMGPIANVVVGIVGAVLGGFIMRELGGAGVSGFNLYSLIVAIFGAIILVFLIGFLQRA
ncbi:MAG: GlsB/YeaQ/YmgE family stress response membrane protein [Aliifodinibius sp.]|nr:GlsB/YeaQ/YmgE family stress response membrane protein [Fodinibius sp.]NIV14740.1 GlsB/YeaQ/YmgE family stress response membrane protein [Fodinibius sp.]NIY28635.1 GlsB/YeaQ/YmgE family stress response membrane protein [Fodinibius sp.]